MKTQRHIDRKTSQRLRNHRTFSLARVGLLWGLLGGSANAAPIKWDNSGITGGVIGSWATPANWDGNAIPGTGDDVILDDTAYTFPANSTVALGGAFTIQSLTFNSANLVGLNSAASGTTSNMLTLTKIAGSDLITVGSSAASTVTLGLTTGTLTASVTNNGNFNVSSGKTLAFGTLGKLAGAGVWTLIGGGTLSLSNTANSYTGGGVVKDGTLKLGVAGVLTDGVGLAVGSGGTSAVFDLNGKNETIGVLSGDSTGVITNNSGAGTSILTTTFTGTSTFGGVIQDAATGATGGKVALTLGGGTLTLSGANTYSGGTSISAGTLQLSGAGTLGSTSATLSLSGTGALNLNGTNQTIGALSITAPTTTTTVLTGTGVLTLNGSLSYGPAGNKFPATLGTTSSTILDLGNATRAFNVVANNNGSGDLVINALIRNGGINYVGTLGGSDGTVVPVLKLIAANTYALGTSVSGSAILQIGGSSTVTAGGAVASGPVGTGVLTLATGTSLTSDGSSARTLQNSLSLSGAVALGSSSYAGALNFNSTDGTNTLATPATVTLTAATALTTNVAVGITDVVSGGFALTKGGSGTLTLSGANTYSGGTTLSTGTLALGSSTTVGSGAVTSGPVGTGLLTIGTGTVLASNAATTGGDRTINNNLSLSGAITFGTSTNTGVLTFDNTALTTRSTALTADTALTTTASAIIYNNITGVGFSLSKTGSGYLELGGTNSFSGSFTASGGITYLDFDGALGSVSAVAINTGATVLRGYASNTNLINDSATVTLAGSGTLNVSAGTETLGSLAGTSSTSSVVIGDFTSGATTYPGSLTVGSNGGSTAFAGVISGTRANSGPILTKIGAGTLTLSGANTYTGLTDVQVGTLAYGASNVLADTSTVRVSGGTLGMSTYSDTVGGVQLTNGSITGTGTLTSATAFDVRSGTVSAVLAGSVGLNKTTSGTVALSGVNLYSGTTSVQEGVLQLTGGANRLPVASVVTLGAATTAGKLILGDATAASNQTVTGLTTTGNGGSVVGGNTGTASVLTTNVASGTNTFAGTLGGANTTENSLALAKIGSGTLALSAANTYAGGTTISAGTVRLGASGAAGTGAVTMSAGNLYGGDGTSNSNAVTIGTASSSATGALLSWNFFGQSSPDTSTPYFINSSLGTASDLSRGTGAASSTGSNSFRTTGFKNDGISTTNNDYFQFSLTPGAGKTVSLSTINAIFAGTAGFYASPGVSSQWAYSLDGNTYNLIGTASQSTSLTLSSDVSVAALQNLTSTSTVYFRYYASGQTTTGGWGYTSSSAAAANDGLTLSGTYSLPATGSGTLGIAEAGSTTFGGAITVNNTATLTAVSGGTATFSGVIGGAGSITKTGVGTVELANTNTFSGGTTVSAGSLRISNTADNGSATGSGAVSVSTTGTLLGTGYINAGANKITVDGTLSPGVAGTPVAPGTIHLTSTATNGALTLSSTSTLMFDIISTSSKDLVMLGSMNLNSLTLGGGTLALNLPDLTRTGIDYTQVYTIFSGVSGLSAGSAFGSVTGYDASDYAATFAYDATNHNYNLSFTEVPEPTTVLGGMLLLGAAGWGQRRRLRRVWQEARRAA